MSVVEYLRLEFRTPVLYVKTKKIYKTSQRNNELSSLVKSQPILTMAMKIQEKNSSKDFKGSPK